MRIVNSLIICLIFIVSLDGQESKIRVPEQIIPQRASNKNYLPKVWNESIGSSDLNITRSINGESLMGNFVCDAMLNYMQTDFAIISYDELYGDLVDGSTGFNLLNELDQTQIFRTGILLRDMLIDHIKQYSPLNQKRISIDNRWLKK